MVCGLDLSNTYDNISTRVTLPADFEKGKAVLVGALYSIYGASHSPVCLAAVLCSCLCLV